MSGKKHARKKPATKKPSSAKKKKSSRASGRESPRKKGGAGKSRVPATKPARGSARKVAAPKKPRTKRAVAKSAVERALPTVVREVETIVGARELVIRGYWDRYPSSDQRKHHRKYDAIAKDQRRGPTAYDLLMRDYNRFTPAQRRNLTVRVVYGVAPDTGQVLSARKITTAGMSLDIPSTRSEALDTLRVLLVRAGVVDSPKEWRVNKNAVRIEQHVPLGIQWVVVERETVASEWVTQHPRGAKGRFVKRGK